MATNSANRLLKAFVQYDASGRKVPSSLVLRKQKPKVGNWKEEKTYQCCNDVTMTTTAATTITNFKVKFYCAGTLVSTLTSGQNSSSIANLVTLLNTTYPLLGTFSNPSGSTIQLVMPFAQKQALCSASKTLTFTVTA